MLRKSKQVAEFKTMAPRSQEVEGIVAYLGLEF